MAKNDLWNFLLTGSAIIGGAWLISELIKSFSDIVYKCPYCGCEVNKNQDTCRNCNSKLK